MGTSFTFPPKMLFILGALLIPFVTIHGKDCECGVANMDNPAIRLREMIAGNHAWPWMVSIVNISGDSTVAYCGASLINDLYLLSAAHCIPDMNTTGLNFFRLILGSNFINNGSTMDAMIEQIITHEKFDLDTGDNDIALIKMDRRVPFTKNVSPICLRKEDSLDHRVATFTGWGSYNISEPTEDILKEDEAMIVPNAICKENYTHVDIIITENMLCAYDSSYPPLYDASLPCKGDSGGPLVIKNEKTGHYNQIGIVSHGQGCGFVVGYPSIFTRVGNYIHWIRNNTLDGLYCQSKPEVGQVMEDTFLSPFYHAALTAPTLTHLT